MSGMGRAQRRVALRRVARPGELHATRAGDMVTLQAGSMWWTTNAHDALRLAWELRDAATDIIEEERHPPRPEAP